MQNLTRAQKLKHIRNVFKGKGLRVPRVDSHLYRDHIEPMLDDSIQGGSFLGQLSRVLGYVSAGTGIAAPIASFIPPLAPISAGLGVISTLSGVGSKVAQIADIATETGSGLKKRRVVKKTKKSTKRGGELSSDMVPMCFKPYDPYGYDEGMEKPYYPEVAGGNVVIDHDEIFVNGNPETPKIMQSRIAKATLIKSPYDSELEQVVVNKASGGKLSFRQKAALGAVGLFGLTGAISAGLQGYGDYKDHLSSLPVKSEAYDPFDPYSMPSIYGRGLSGGAAKRKPQKKQITMVNGKRTRVSKRSPAGVPLPIPNTKVPPKKITCGVLPKSSK